VFDNSRGPADRAQSPLRRRRLSRELRQRVSGLSRQDCEGGGNARRDAETPRLPQLHGGQMARHAPTEAGATGPFDGWPLGRGFDRFYGFMDAETDQYAPELVRDNTPIDAPGGYSNGYHLTEDLTDQAIRYIADHTADAPQTPWLTWLAFGACHAPHQAPAELIRHYD